MNQYQGFDENLSLEGKTAVITGGASGIGRATAGMMVRKGARVVILDRDPRVGEAAEEIGNGTLGLTADLTDYDQVEASFQEVLRTAGGIDIVCNIAGLGSGTPAEKITKEEFLRVINVNLNAVFFVSQVAGRIMLRQGRGGRIINMSSQAGVVALHGHVAYSASKAGLMAVTRDLALEWGKYGITVNSVAPTVVMTPMAKDYWVGERGAAHLAQIPAGRFAEMDEIAMAFVYLASDAAAMINGANLVVDGGFTIN
ncbi:MAG: D-threitol dehydrogenase [Lachnospiraceae bacterium]|nr:D-threitol dehydrogenase [Lachnospiraceae bacterium]